LAAFNIQVDERVPSDAPVSDAPVSDAPVSDAPVSDVPVSDVPVSDEDAVVVPSATDSGDILVLTPPTTPLIAPPVVIQPQLPLDPPKPKLTFGSLSPTIDADAPTQSDFFTTATRGMLNQRFTFDRFIIGSSNRLASAACMAVADHPAQAYNPLFLYGGVGLGKTHLLHAIGNAALERDAEINVLYVSSEKFTNDLINAIRRQQTEEFRIRYRNIDILLIDDIQFFSGKSRTQEEFFYAFEALLGNKAQVIITSDTYPKEMAGIDDRLISRFDSGLTVAIEPPELEMRVAILMKKAISEGIPMSEDVAFFVAKHLRSNVRELEGALRKILAFVRFHGREVTIEVARVALKDLLSIQNRQISVENIQKSVADFYSIKVADMYSKKRPANIARPRQIAMFMAKELTQKSLPEIGELFGGRDHTTVLHAVRKIAEERAHDGQLNHEIHVIEQTLKA